MFEDENLNQKKSAWARKLLFLKDLTHVMKKSQKYLPINFSKGTFFYKDRWKPFWPILTGNECLYSQDDIYTQPSGQILLRRLISHLA